MPTHLLTILLDEEAIEVDLEQATHCPFCDLELVRESHKNKLGVVCWVHIWCKTGWCKRRFDAWVSICKGFLTSPLDSVNS